MAEAFCSFRRVIRERRKCEAEISRLLREIPVTRGIYNNKKLEGQDIEFNESEFINWLQTGYERIKNFSDCPKRGNMLKCEESSGKVIQLRMEKTKQLGRGSRIETRKRSNHVWIVVFSGILIVIACAFLIAIFVMRKPAEESKAVTKQGIVSLDVKISPDIKLISPNIITRSNDVSADKKILSLDSTGGEQ